MNKFLKTDWLIYLVFMLTCIFVLLQSPLAPLAKTITGIDSSVFIYCAQQIQDGQLMYKDIADHKGPFLYLINVIAMYAFSGKWIGIWIFEILSMFATCILMYKTARLFASKFISVLSVVTSILTIVPLFFGGNFTEEWALPYISTAIYIFLSYLKENKPLTTLKLCLLSFTFVLTLMLRANLIAVWGGFSIALILKWSIEKQYKELFRYLSLMLIFVFMAILPFFLYFYLTGTLSDAIYFVFQFNLFEYAATNTLIQIIMRGIFIVIGMYSRLNFIPCFVIIYLFFTKKDRYAGVILAFLLTIISCSLGHSYQHYYIILVPLFVIPLAYLYDTLKQYFQNKSFIWLCALFVFYNSANIYTQYSDIKANYSENRYKYQMDALVDIISKQTKETDKILVTGNHVAIYLYSHRIAATRFPYDLMYSSLEQQYYVQEIEKNLPKMIIETNYDTYNIQPILDTKYQPIKANLRNIKVWLLKE
jgi:hypothetical protein